jgi:endo-1,4-beta-xylanase
LETNMKIRYCFYALSLLLAVHALAQTDSKFEAYLAEERAQLPYDGELLYNCANLGGYRYGGGSGSTKKIVDADPALPFAKASQLKIKQVGANPWEPQFQSPTNIIPLSKGDVLFYIFYIRGIESADPGGEGKGILYVQRSSSPWTGLGSISLTFKSSWRKMYLVAQATEDYSVNTMEFTIHLGSQAQTVEVGGVIALNLGQGVNIADLPRNPLYWDGMEADAAWRAEAEARIESNRKGDLTVIVKNQNNDVVKNAAVSVNMKNHAFGFGTFISNLVLQNSTNAKKYKAELLKLFNRATTPFYMGDGSWGWYSSESVKQEYMNMAGWLQDNNIPAKGHVLVWPSWMYMPPFFRNYENDPAGMRAAIEEHLDTLVPIGKDKGLIEWDVVNEPHINHDVMDICGDEVMVEWYKRVHEIDPNPRLILNEYNIIMGGGDPAFQADFERYIELLLNGGAPLGGLGVQCHFDENLPGIPRVLEILDRFAKYGLPIQVTEFDIDTFDEEGQANFTRDFFTAIFSHPITNKFVMWGFWEGDQWKPNGSMIRTNWTYKPNYDVYNDLVFNKWWTREEGVSNRQGVYQTRGFLGEYDISATFDGHTVTQVVNLVKEGAAVELQIPTTETGLEENKKVPQEYGLKQNFPNPFNASTVIEFMPERTGAAELKIYDTAGKNVWTHPLTVHKDVVYRQEIDFSTIPSGSYFYTVAMKDGSTPVRKMMLVK